MTELKTNSPFSDPRRLLVLGNGFDLDLGYKTGYKDFVQNENSFEEGHFPFIKGRNDYHALGRFILKCTCIQKWYDLENILAEYGRIDPSREYRSIIRAVSSFPVNTVEKYFGSIANKMYDNEGRVTSDRNDYNRLVESLQLYLNSLVFTNPKKKSVAARLLREIYGGFIPPTVYTFNYTNLVKIGDALGLNVISPIYVHGSLDNKDIILGVGDYAELRQSAHYLYKTSNENYTSTDMFGALDSSDEIYIFGLSMSQVDYPYFEDFFSKVASGGFGDKIKYIRIFTFDDSSRSDILYNLRKMNKGMIKLKGYADIDIIRTKDDIDEKKVLQVLEKLKNNWEIGWKT